MHWLFQTYEATMEVLVLYLVSEVVYIGLPQYIYTALNNVLEKFMTHVETTIQAVFRNKKLYSPYYIY